MTSSSMTSSLLHEIHCGIIYEIEDGVCGSLVLVDLKFAREIEKLLTISRTSSKYHVLVICRSFKKNIY